MLVLRDIRQMRKITEGPNHRYRRLDVERVERSREFGARLGVAIATEPHSQAPDVLYDLKELDPLVRAHCLSEKPPEKTYVFAQRCVLRSAPARCGPSRQPVSDLGHKPH